MNSIISNKKIITAALGLVLTGFTGPSQVWADPADQKSTDSAPFRFQSTANILAKDQGTPEKMPDELPSDLYPASEGVYSGQEPAHTNRATDSATHEGEATNPAPGRPEYDSTPSRPPRPPRDTPDPGLESSNPNYDSSQSPPDLSNSPVTLPNTPGYDDTQYHPDLGLVAFDSQGQLRTDIPALQIQEGQDIVSSPDCIFNREYCQALTNQDKAEILKNLSLFMQSRYASKVILPRKVMLVSRVKDDLCGHIYDMERLEEHDVRVPANLGDAWSQLAAQAMRPPAEQAGIKVIVNTESNKYHLPGADHISQTSRSYVFQTENLAKRQGYTPCSVCFPKENSYLSMSRRERELSREGIAQVQSRYNVSQDSQAIARVREVGRKLLTGNGYPADHCDFILLNSQEAQALSVYNGPIFITSGLLNLLENDDELAAVLGHEFAHILHKHPKASRNRSNAVSILGNVLRYTTRSYWGYIGARQAANLVNQGFSREQEYEADATSVLLTFAAGYDPNEFCNTLEKLDLFQKQMGRGLSIPWFSSHPTSAKRVKEVRKACQKLGSLRESVQVAEKFGDTELAQVLRKQARSYMQESGSIKKFLHSYQKLKLEN